MYKRQRLEIKPLSVNQCRTISRGKKIKTKQYREYQEKVKSELLYRKIEIELPEKGELYLSISIGVNTRFDIDNCAKPFIDILQNFFGFNDNRITHLVIKKYSVKKGFEFIEFQLSPLFPGGKQDPFRRVS